MDDSTRPSEAPTVLAGGAGEAPTVLGRDASGGISQDAATVLSGSAAGDAPTYAAPASTAGRSWPRGPRPSPGQAFGPYVITRLLGSGGMGDVYEALHSEHGRRVALKILGHRLSGPDDVVRFLREGELAASLTHPNTVYVYGSEEIDGSPVIAMELLPGGTLKDLVETRGPLPAREAVDLVLQVIAGLEAAEAAGILHRDIKPANCFIDRDGAVKVGDFGLSISTRGREGAATGSFQGTPQFAPPEQIRGEALDVRADIYAVGATLFYLLTGKPPFDDADLTTLINRVQDETARSPREMRAGVPEALADVVARCLSKDRSARPGTYAELEGDLRAFSSSAPTPAPLGRRVLAGLLDGACISFLIVPMTMPLVFRQQGAGFQWTVRGMQIGTAILYYALLEGRWGSGIGKAICGIAVIREGGRRLGVARAAARAAMYQVSSVLGLIPMLIVGPLEYTRFTLEHPGWAGLIGLGFGGVVLLLFIPARRRNGFEAVHDRVTGTRVVRRTASASRAAVVGSAPAAVAAAAPGRQYGPFGVVGTIGLTTDGALLTAIDARLQRRVWIREQPAGAPPIPAELRDLGRPGRLRWLGGRRTASEAWDAYEAFDGAALASIAPPQSWRRVKRWLLDLAAEIDAGLADGSLPPLTIDRVWLTRAGRARLLDFPAPGAPPAARIDPPPTLASAQRWLAAMAERGLAGRARSADDAPVLPLSARAILDRLAAGSFASAADIVSTLTAVQPQADVVAGWRRAWSVGLGGLTPVIFALLGFFASFALQRASVDLVPLANSLDRLTELQRPGHDADAPERAALEIYVAARFRPLIADELTWSMVAGTKRLINYRALAMRVVQERPTVTADELAEATARLGAFAQAQDKERSDAARRGRISFAVVPTFLFVAGFATAAGFGVVLAVIFDSGLLMRLFGIGVVTRRGARASRLRVAGRALAAWLPAAAFAGAMWVAGVTYTNDTYHVRSQVALVAAIVSLATFLVGALWAGLRPARGPQDHLAGTWLVPR